MMQDSAVLREDNYEWKIFCCDHDDGGVCFGRHFYGVRLEQSGVADELFEVKRQGLKINDFMFKK